jgi:uncharacterized membrane protein
MKSALFSLLVFVPAAAAAFEKFDCFGTEPFWDATLTENQIIFKFMNAKATNYSRPTYKSAANAPSVTSIEARSGTSTLIAFVVDVTEMMFVRDKNGKEVVDREYVAYCSDGMSPLGHPFSIHLIIDGKAYTGCCSTTSKPSVGQDSK